VCRALFRLSATLWAFCTKRLFEFHKSGQLFIGAHNETLSVVAMVRQQSRSFARENQPLRRSPNSKENERISTMPFLPSLFTFADVRWSLPVLQQWTLILHSQ
jgi:hypothetical protein